MALCTSCREGVVVTRANGSVRTFCNITANLRLMPNDVERCTAYDDARFTAKYELEKIGWMLKTDKRGAALGFVPPDRKDD